MMNIFYEKVNVNLLLSLISAKKRYSIGKIKIYLWTSTELLIYLGMKY